jgi:hypothetical protein
MDRAPNMRGCRWRAALFAAVIALIAAAPGCEGGGHFTVFGYTTKPNYNCDIRTIYVPIFKNRTFRRGLEFDVTRAVIREIEAKTPYKVVSDCDHADSELIGTIVSTSKALVNLNPENEVREAETTLTVEVIWRDRRTGEILTKPPQTRSPLAPGTPLLAGPALSGGQNIQGAPLAPVQQPGLPGVGAANPETAPPYLLPDDPIPIPPPPPPVLVQSVAHNIPELGQSTASSFTGNVDRLATQIVSMMENPW